MVELRETVTNILNNKNLEITLTSPDDRYSIAYSTSIVAKEVVDPSSWSRTYWMRDNTL